jgi:hypothetical protein
MSESDVGPMNAARPDTAGYSTAVGRKAKGPGVSAGALRDRGSLDQTE